MKSLQKGRYGGAWLLLGWTLWLAAPASAGDMAAEPRRLEPGVPLERPIADGATHVYEVELPAGGHWRIAVEQRRVDVAVEVTTPEGRSLSMDGPTGRIGPEIIVLEAVRAGVFRIEVRDLAVANNETGSYEIVAEELREVSREDRWRLAAETTRMEALQLGSAEEAGAKYRESLGSWRLLKDDREIAATLFLFASWLTRSGDRASAIEHFREAISLQRALADIAGTAQSLNGLGYAYWKEDNNEEAVRFLREALPLQQRVGDRYEEAKIRGNLCLAYINLGEFEKALEHSKKERELYAELGAKVKKIKALVSWGGLLESWGDPAEAVEVYQEALEIRRLLGDEMGMASLYNNIAVAYRRLGRFQQAVKHYDLALDIFSRHEMRAETALALGNKGRAYIALGEYAQARSFLESALALSVELREKGIEMAARMNLGRMHSLLGEHAEALDYYRHAYKLAREMKSRQQMARCLLPVGESLLAVGEPLRALERFEGARELFEEIGDGRGQAAALRWRGRVRLFLDQPSPALKDLEQSYELEKELENPSGQTQALYDLARALRELGRLRKALDRVREAIRIIEQMRLEILSPTLRSSFLGAQRSAYELEIEVLMALAAQEPATGREGEALEASERTRARTLVELLGEAEEVYELLPPDLRQEQLRLRQRLSSYAALHAEPSVAREQPSARDARNLRAAMPGLLSELENLEAEIRERSPRYADLTRPRPITLSEIQRLLDAETVLLEFFLGERRSFLWAVTSDAVEVRELPPADEIEPQVRQVYEQLSHRDLDPGAARREQEAAATLSRTLIGDFDLTAWKRLVVVGDGVLHYLPFAALPQPSSDPPLPLLTRHEVVYLPSALALQVQRGESRDLVPGSRRAIVLADPVFDVRDSRVQAAPKADEGDASPPRYDRLPATLQEANAIAALAPEGEVEMAVGFEANRSRVLEGRLTPYRIVHFATHGEIDTAYPALSKLVLSGVSPDGSPCDGALYFNDIFHLKLHADLVVLSGCRTALGKEVRGEGLVGLTRGFMYAGAPRLVASLWPVQDQATAQLMTELYRAMWQDDLPPAAALQSAQRKVREQSRWQDPFFWAGFVLLGDWR